MNNYPQSFPAIIFLICLWGLVPFSLQAQQAKTDPIAPIKVDHQPRYKSWKPEYILEKIVYTETETIFHFKFVTKKKKGSDAIFYHNKHAYAWVAVDHDQHLVHTFESIQNIRRDGELILEKLSSGNLTVPYCGHQGCTFTCEIHFERFPEGTYEIDLIEGLGEEKNRNHFNFFKVRVQ